MKEIKIAARWARTEVLVRREVATVAIVLVPKVSLHILPEEERAGVVEQAHRTLSARSFASNKDGDKATLLDSYLSQYFHVEVNEEESTWEYDGGEVSTLSTHYDRSFELP